MKKLEKETTSAVGVIAMLVSIVIMALGLFQVLNVKMGWVKISYPLTLPAEAPEIIWGIVLVFIGIFVLLIAYKK